MTRRMREPFHTMIWKASVGYNDSWSQVDPEVLEKFAELIVQECLDIMNDERYNRTMLTVNPVESGAIYDAYHNIKSRFGMK